VQIGLGARHGDIEEPPLLLDQIRPAGRELGREVAVGDVEDVHRVPLLALRRMHRGEHQVVLVEVRRAREVARRLRRIQSQLRQKCFPALKL
jgi:hypothetical protein